MDHRAGRVRANSNPRALRMGCDQRASERGHISTGSVTFAGTAPYNYKTVRFETPGCDPGEADFSSLSNWSATVPVILGRQTISLRVYDPHGVLIPAASHDYVVIGTNATLFTDIDSDGLSDAWECATGLDNIPAATAASDQDGDGQTNEQEYLAGTDPLDSTSFLTVSFQSVAGNNITLTLAAAAGRTYRVQISPSLATGSWTTEQTITPLTMDQTLHPSLSAPPSTSRIFVRIIAP